ncbi:helix-turn-helix domain-containing protein [Oerskovia sp. Sa1BUA8]|uniref:Helix-turn-helix domain-containing protein n=1 Tax=Oerskovia douganii TaxID=2762210 RepID=A0A9D5UKP3_9CELL|nr:helix-turn-helix domain-containing protein [Oerskovia douganii]MBE7702282.1 helix-turn-helix domain-containing protein [Oerskovia douganii]
MQDKDAVKNGESAQDDAAARAINGVSQAVASWGRGRVEGATSLWGRATSGVTLVTLAAIISTALSFQGMYSTTTSTLGMTAAVGLALSGFLELAVLGVARLLQNAIKEGRAATVERVGTWVLSLASGVFSAAHQLVGPADAAGVHHWSLGDPLTQIGAALRLAAPLAACWLWERRLRSERVHAAQRRPRHVALRDRHIMRVSLAAAAVRTARAATFPGTSKAAGLVRALFAVRQLSAAGRMRRRYVAYWRRYPITNPEHHAALMAGLRAAGLGDLLPELTAPNSELLNVMERNPIRVAVHADVDQDDIDDQDDLDHEAARIALDLSTFERGAITGPDPRPTSPVNDRPVPATVAVTDRPLGPVTAAERALILDLAATGISEREIHRRTRRSRDTIKRTIDRYGPADAVDQDRSATGASLPRVVDRPATGFTVARA